MTKQYDRPRKPRHRKTKQEKPTKMSVANTELLVLDEESGSKSVVEEEKENKIITYLLYLLIILMVCLIGYTLVVYRNIYKENLFSWGKTTVEYGDVQAKPVAKVPKTTAYIRPLDVYQLGEQTVQAYVYKDGVRTEKAKTFMVKDTKKPVLKVKHPSLRTTLGKAPNYDDFGIEATDPVDGEIAYSIDPVDWNVLGEHPLEVVATDCNNKQTKKKVHVTVGGSTEEEDLAMYREQVQILLEKE